MTFPTVVERNNGTPGDVFNIVVPIPGSAQAGDLMVIVDSSQTNSGSTTWPSGWTQVLAPTSNNEAAARWKALDSGDIATGSVTVTRTAHGNAAWSRYVLRGAQSVEGSGCIDTSQDPPSLTPSWGAKDTLWICMSTGRGSNPDFVGYPTNYGNGMFSGGNGSYLATAERQLNAASEDPGAFNWSFHIQQQAGTIAVRPSPSVSGFSPGLIG